MDLVLIHYCQVCVIGGGASLLRRTVLECSFFIFVSTAVNPNMAAELKR